MKIKIGSYSSDLIPIRRWEKAYEFWRKPETCYLPEEEYTKYDKFVFGFFDKLENLIRPINRWSNNRKRKIKIHVDYYDIWNADHTIGIIITPILKKLKEYQHGYPHVDNEDVPEVFHMSNDDQNESLNGDSIDAIHEARWDYVLGEMIWAFEQHAYPDNADQFFHNPEQLDMIFNPIEGIDASSLSFNRQKDSTKPAYWYDKEGHRKYNERKRNGLRLFAKYYESLWD